MLRELTTPSRTSWSPEETKSKTESPRSRRTWTSTERPSPKKPFWENKATKPTKPLLPNITKVSPPSTSASLLWNPLPVVKVPPWCKSRRSRTPWRDWTRRPWTSQRTDPWSRLWSPWPPTPNSLTVVSLDKSSTPSTNSETNALMPSTLWPPKKLMMLPPTKPEFNNWTSNSPNSKLKSTTPPSIWMPPLVSRGLCLILTLEKIAEMNAFLNQRESDR